jgi:hypothetical protein
VTVVRTDGVFKSKVLDTDEMLSFNFSKREPFLLMFSAPEDGWHSFRATIGAGLSKQVCSLPAQSGRI